MDDLLCSSDPNLFGRLLAFSASHGRRSSRRVCRSPRWSDDDGERRIVTAVAGSSNKVGGKKTQIVGLRPLERSVQLRAAVRVGVGAKGQRAGVQSVKERCLAGLTEGLDWVADMTGRAHGSGRRWRARNNCNEGADDAKHCGADAMMELHGVSRTIAMYMYVGI